METAPETYAALAASLTLRELWADKALMII